MKGRIVMVLNYECLRKTLMLLEDVLELNDEYEYRSIGIHQIVDYPALSNEYDKKEIAYSIYMMIDAGLLQKVPTSINAPAKEQRVDTITYKGHEFLQKIKNETAWKKTMDKLKPVGTITIEMISQVISNVITNMINQ